VLDLHDAVCPLLDADGLATDHAAAIVALVRERGPFALVVVDPLARLAGASIDADNGAAGALVSVLEEVATAAGGLVLAVHHTSLNARRNGTTDATAIRGATGLGDSARLVMLLSVQDLDHGDADVDARLGEVVTLRLVKRNHVPAWEPVELRRGEHGELLALDASDVERVEQARAAASPSQREATRRSEREATRGAHDGAADAKRQKREAAEGEKVAREDAAARAILAERGDQLSCREWYAAMRARLEHCSKDRAEAARERVRPR
jgi:RecA-family ATPase